MNQCYKLDDSSLKAIRVALKCYSRLNPLEPHPHVLSNIDGLIYKGSIYKIEREVLWFDWAYSPITNIVDDAPRPVRIEIIEAVMMTAAQAAQFTRNGRSLFKALSPQDLPNTPSRDTKLHDSTSQTNSLLRNWKTALARLLPEGWM